MDFDKLGPNLAQLQQDVWELWGRFSRAAAATGRLRGLHFNLCYGNTAALVHGLAQLHCLRKLSLWFERLPHEQLGELARVGSLSALTSLWLCMAMSGEPQTLRLPPAALSRLERLMGAAGRHRRLPSRRGCCRPGLPLRLVAPRFPAPSPPPGLQWTHHVPTCAPWSFLLGCRRSPASPASAFKWAACQLASTTPGGWQGWHSCAS